LSKQQKTILEELIKNSDHTVYRVELSRYIAWKFNKFNGDRIYKYDRNELIKNLESDIPTEAKRLLVTAFNIGSSKY